MDMTRVFIDEEYKIFPYAPHDDMLDCLARIRDEKLGACRPAPPSIQEDVEKYDALRYGL
jgi:hypothetical protein